ncbi:Phospholipase A(1) DAD1, chloroplastic [Linum grandiflorum]
MVQSGFLSLYTSGPENGPSLQETIRGEIQRLVKLYSGEPLSLTITGHSLGAALATLAAYDIKMELKRTSSAPATMITVVSFGGPRVGDKRFKQQLDKEGIKVLRIVNSDDVITKVPPGFDGGDHSGGGGWMRRWVYSEVGKELRLSSRKCSPYLNGINVATCHDLRTYLHLVNGYVSSSCPFRSTSTSS